MEKGTVVCFKSTWGFIRPNNGGPDVFVYYNKIIMKGRKELKEGQAVEYDVAPRETDGKPQAVNVRVLEVV